VRHQPDKRTPAEYSCHESKAGITLRDHRYLNVRMDVSMQFHGDSMVAETLIARPARSSVCRSQCPAPSRHQRCPWWSRTEDLALFTGLRLDDDGKSLEPVSFCRGILFYPAMRSETIFSHDSWNSGCQALPQWPSFLHQIISGIAVRNLDEVAHFTQFVDIFP